MNLSFHISSLVFVLLTFQVVHNEAGKLATQTKSSLNGSSNAVYGEKFLNSSERSVESTELAVIHQEARDSSKYSYFYIASWTWHIPLWFTLWFSFYVFFNVIRAIYGHAVINKSHFTAETFLINFSHRQINPDDYLRRKREAHDAPSIDDLNRLTDFAIKSFEKFKTWKSSKFPQ